MHKAAVAFWIGIVPENQIWDTKLFTLHRQFIHFENVQIEDPSTNLEDRFRRFKADPDDSLILFIHVENAAN